MLRVFRASRYYLTPRTSIQAHRSAPRLSRSTFPSAPSLLQQPHRTPSVAPISTRAKLSKGEEPETVLSEDFEEIEPTPVPQQVTLRPYQIECITAVLNELQKGTSTRLGVSAPTGALPLERCSTTSSDFADLSPLSARPLNRKRQNIDLHPPDIPTPSPPSSSISRTRNESLDHRQLDSARASNVPLDLARLPRLARRDRTRCEAQGVRTCRCNDRDVPDLGKGRW